WRIDPYRGRHRLRLRQPVREALGMTRERIGKYQRTHLMFRHGESVVHVVRCEQPQPDVMVLGVVPGEEVTTEAAPVLDRAEPFRKVGPVLHRLELRLGERV